MLDLVLIRPGKFLMGSETAADEKPVHEVTISQRFYLGKYEVTQAQWEAVMGSNPSYIKGASLPVEQVSWEDCQLFIEKLNGKGVGTFRLPTEAEWEYACRAGTREARYGPVDQVAWHAGNSGGQVHPVGQKRPNPWGLYDMLGNVWEWCFSLYGPYPQGRVTDPVGGTRGASVVIRGGAYDSPERYTRAAARNYRPPGRPNPGLGFRLAWSPSPAEEP